MSYRDSEERYYNDPVFHVGVNFMRKLAEEHELTPGELRQIASHAAWMVEMYRGTGRVRR